MENINKYTPDYAIVEVTLACNFKCMHCGASAGNKRSDELTLEELRILFKNLKSIGCKGVSLMGGEILLRKDWTEIAQAIVDLNMGCAIITNGYLLTDNHLKIMKEIGISQIGISLDGAFAETQDKIRGLTGCFNRTLEAINRSLKHNIPIVTVITAVNKMNIQELPEIFSLLLKFNKHIDWQLKLASSHNSDRFPENNVIDEQDYIDVAYFISEIKKLIQKNNLKLEISEAHDMGYNSSTYPNLSQDWQGCVAGIKTIGIQSNGGIKGCLSLPDEFIEGNIREDNLIELWNDPSKFSYSRNFKKADLKGICEDCNKSHTCNGGCSDFSYSLTKSVHNTPFCLYHIEQTYLH